jgi:hypothetical protein
MNFYLKKLLFPTLFVLSFFTLSSVCKKATKNFSVLSISHSLENTQAPLPQELEYLKNQKFTFLGKGAQAFVFLSEDKKTVIKFIRFDHLLPKPLIRLFSFIPHPFIQKKIDKSNREISELLASFNTAFEHFQDETCVLYFQKNPLPYSLSIVDPLGIEHKIQKAPFLIQSYAEPIENIWKKTSIETAKDIVDQYFSFCLKKMDHHILDEDPNLITNFGLSNGKLIEIDVGRFYKSEKYLTNEAKKQDLQRMLDDISLSLVQKDPELIQYFQNKIDGL